MVSMVNRNMSESADNLEKKIKTWLVEEYFDADIVLVPNPNVFFQIRIKNKNAGAAALPSYITLANDVPDRLIVSFYWQLDEKQIKSISALKLDAKKKFQKELAQGFLLMNMLLIPEPSIENIQRIKAQTLIILDGLNKHTLISSIIKVNSAHGYILSLFDLLMDQGFDPYKQL